MKSTNACFILNLDTKELKEIDKDQFLQAIIKNTQLLSKEQKAEKYKELKNKTYNDIVKAINLQKISPNIFGTAVGNYLCFILINKVKEDLEKILKDKGLLNSENKETIDIMKMKKDYWEQLKKLIATNQLEENGCYCKVEWDEENFTVKLQRLNYKEDIRLQDDLKFSVVEHRYNNEIYNKKFSFLELTDYFNKKIFWLHYCPNGVYDNEWEMIIDRLCSAGIIAKNDKNYNDYLWGLYENKLPNKDTNFSIELKCDNGNIEFSEDTDEIKTFNSVEDFLNYCNEEELFLEDKQLEAFECIKYRLENMTFHLRKLLDYSRPNYIYYYDNGDNGGDEIKIDINIYDDGSINFSYGFDNGTDDPYNDNKKFKNIDEFLNYLDTTGTFY